MAAPLQFAYKAVDGAGLPQEGIDQGGLAVVDVGDDGNVANVLHESVKCNA